ncbi:unnamed protein product [Macrosiphum euphorbiae]|uniref:BESS domain-containing protein n=1 Tax=Macrosiphum euphorbiae TaxID=13131 RepID=A0AAV0XI97_9HEMI|nr:unnamed protein product [Macrosiphum euphorbiae]
MLFLKDTVTPRISDGNISDVDVDEVEEDINEEQDELEDIDQSLEVNISTNDYNISSPPSTSFTTTKKKNKRSKKQETGNTFEQQLIDLETRKLAALTESPAPDDEDMHFFKSILPYFKKMSPIQKLRVRNEIQNILIRESVPPQQYFGSTNSHNQNYIIPSASTVHPTYTSIPPNFQYPDDTHSSIQN